MNRQSANYFESVGDNQHYEWQTPKHNFVCLLFTLFFLGLIFLAFYLLNTVHPSCFSIESYDSVRNISSFEYYIEIEKGDDGRPSRNMDYQLYRDRKKHDGWSVYSKYSIDPEIIKQQYIEMRETMTPLHDTCIEEDGTKSIYNYFSMQKVHTKIKGHPLLLNCERWKYDQKDPFKLSRRPFISESTIYPYAREYERYYNGDTVVLMRTDEYRAFTTTEHTKDTIIDGRTSTKQRTCYMPKEPSSMPELNVEAFYGNLWKFFWEDFCTSSLRIEKLKFPRAKQKRLVISYTSPMYFDAISIKPDSTTDTELVYSSPKKLEQIDKNGLYVYARSIANMNIQETLNFLCATLIGILISFLIEFNKRLYNHRHQYLYSHKKPYRRFERLFGGLMCWWLIDKCKSFRASRKQSRLA